MTIANTGSNTTGSRGLVAVDKVGNKIRFYDPETIREVKVIDGPEPCVHELAINPEHTWACVPLYGDGIYGGNKNPNNKVVVLDLIEQKIADVITLGKEYVAPHGMVAVGGSKVWLTCDIPNKLVLLDVAKREIEAVYDCPAKGPHILIANGDASRLYSSAKEGDIGVFDATARKFIATIAVRKPGVESGNGAGSEGIATTPDGKHLIAIDNDRGDLRVIDAMSHAEVQRVPMTMQALSNVKRSRLGKLMFSSDGRHLVVTAYTGGNCWICDPADLTRQTLVPVAKGPMGMAFPPDGKSVLVTSHDSGLLTRIDLGEKRAVAAYDGGNGIEVLAYY